MSSSLRKFSQDGADGAGVETEEAEGEGDELKDSFGDFLQDDPFEDREVVLEAGLVGGEIFGGKEIDAGSVDADEADSLAVEVLDQLHG